MSHEAERRFWQCPELVEKVLPFLDSYSTLQLAKASRIKCYPKKIKANLPRRTGSLLRWSWVKLSGRN